MKKNILRKIAWLVPIALLLVAEQSLDYLGINPSLRPYVVPAGLIVIFFSSLVWEWGGTIKRNWPEKREQLQQAWAKSWPEDVRQLVGWAVGLEILLGLFIAYNVEGSLTLKAIHFTLGITTVNVIFLSLWLSVSAEDIKEAEAKMGKKAIG